MPIESRQNAALAWNIIFYHFLAIIFKLLIAAYSHTHMKWRISEMIDKSQWKTNQNWTKLNKVVQCVHTFFICINQLCSSCIECCEILCAANNNVKIITTNGLYNRRSTATAIATSISVSFILLAWNLTAIYKIKTFSTFFEIWNHEISSCKFIPTTLLVIAKMWYELFSTVHTATIVCEYMYMTMNLQRLY